MPAEGGRNTNIEHHERIRKPVSVDKMGPTAYDMKTRGNDSGKPGGTQAQKGNKSGDGVNWGSPETKSGCRGGGTANAEKNSKNEQAEGIARKRASWCKD